MAKKQYKLYFEEDFIEAADAAAGRYGRRSSNAVFEEILLRFFPLWCEVEEENLQAVTNRYKSQTAPQENLRNIHSPRQQNIPVLAKPLIESKKKKA